MDKKNMEMVSSNGHRLVLVPCPLQGHITPMLHLASSCRDVISFLFTLNSKCKEAFRDCLTRVIADRSRGCISCIIFDAVMYSSGEVASELEIPRLALRTSTAANFLGLFLLNQKDSLPNQEHLHPKIAEEFSLMRLKDMPVFNKSDTEVTEEVLNKFHEGTKAAAAIIWNTFGFLERMYLEKIEESHSVPIFPIGPIHKHSNAPSFSLLNEDRSCISWLDSHPSNSVLYVSTGSLITLTQSELTEMACGIADSDQPFLLVIRPGLVNGVSDATCLDDQGPSSYAYVTRKVTHTKLSNNPFVSMCTYIIVYYLYVYDALG